MKEKTKSIGQAICGKPTWANRVVLSIGTALVASGLLVGSSSALAGDEDRDGRGEQPKVFPPDSHPYGADYAQWSARWWQWSFAFPTTADPELGTADFDANQSGRVWFLPTPFNGATLTRKGTIPEGTALFGPVLTTWWDNTGCPNYTDFTADQLKGLVEQNWSPVTETSCTVDGVAVHGMNNPQDTPYFVFSPPFAYTLAAHDNVLAGIFGEPRIPDGTTVFPAVAGGVYVMIEPLPVGHHTIHFGAVVGPIANPALTFDVTFDITVVPHRDHDDGHDHDSR